jgi:putative peptidoglycan lipid II flippase
MHPVPESSPNSTPETQDPVSPDQPIAKVGRSMVNIAAIVAVATLVSKLFGLVRQVAIAAAFGNGPAYDAYNYAYVVPGFLLILLGGINGPFHSAIVSVLAKRDRRTAAPLMETITTLVSLILLVVSVALYFGAEPLMHLTAPGLFLEPGDPDIEKFKFTAEQIANLPLTRSSAVQQLQIMAPMALLAGLVGIGFGTLSSADMYWLPSISPLLSSITVIFGVGWLWLTLGPKIVDPQNAMLGGAVLAGTTLAGAILQWLAQLIPQWKSGMGSLRPRFNFRLDGVGDVMKVLGPATFSSGMLQINVWTDLYFASFIPGAASGMGYANLLVQTPLGILSNMILVPMLPAFAKLAAPENWPELKQRIRQGLMLTAVSMLPLGAMLIALSGPIVQMVYQRGAFSTSATVMTTSLLVAYSIGMFVYLGRDVMVRVFYALGDGDTPFKVSIANILLNAAFDWLFSRVFGWGAPGLVLATVGVNVISMVVFLLILDKRLGGLPLMRWTWPVVGLTGASILGGIVAYLVHYGVSMAILVPRGFANGGDNFILQGLRLGLAGLVGLMTYWWFGSRLNVPEFAQVTGMVQRKLRR